MSGNRSQKVEVSICSDNRRDRLRTLSRALTTAPPWDAYGKGDQGRYCQSLPQQCKVIARFFEFCPALINSLTT
jgi:hypothetical protein